MLLAIGEYTCAAIEADIVLCEDAHRIDHLLVVLKVNEKSALRVDEVVQDIMRNFFQS